MFKKIAHNSTIPALAGNRDLRPLQDLITAEKTVLQTLQRLSADIGKSSEFLRHWGAGEGDALQDTLNASATLLNHFASALSQYAAHEQAIREHMKAVRTREENLDELKRRRKGVIAKADSAEKKLSRMSPEHKSLQQQTELLNGLRQQIQSLDWEIMTDEAKLGDFKRSSVKNWMMLKFGGLLECAEKATIVGELGKLVIDEIPLDITQPGQGPSFYQGFEKTEKLVAEAQRCISEVVFDPVTAELQQSTRSGPQPSSPDASALNYPDRPFATPQLEGLPSNDSGLSPQSNRNSGVYSGSDGLPSLGLMAGSQSNFTTTSQQYPSNATGGHVDEFGFADRDRRGFGTMPMPNGPADGSRYGSNFADSATGSNPTSPSSSRFAPAGGHFATFPVRKSSITTDLPPGQALPPPPQLPGPPSSFRPLDSAPSESASFSAEIADALAHGSNFSTSGGQHHPAASQTSFSVRSSTDGPAPSYESHAPPQPPYGMSMSGLPRGAAPPVNMNPWDEPSVPPPRFSQEGATPRQSEPLSLPQAPQYQPELQINTQKYGDEDEEDTELPYASPPPHEAPQLPQMGLNREDRHVHFGGNGNGNGNGNEQTHNFGEGSLHERNPSEYESSAMQSPHEQHQTRIPSPPPPPQQASERIPSPGPPMDEHSLNAAAAREVAREMDSLSFSPPSITNRSPSPLMPPAPPFAQQQPPPNEGATLASASSGMFRGSRTDIRSGSTDQLVSQTPPPAGMLQQPRPAFGASPAASFTSSAYGTPPEYPSPSIFQPPRTASPASPGALPTGPRTISAAAFKRPQMRAASGESRPLPEITPLSLRKKSGLPGSPYAGPTNPADRERSPGPGSPIQQGLQEQRPRRSVDSAQNAQDHYDFIASYGDADNAGTSPPRQRVGPSGDSSGSPGYGSGKFATNLEHEGLR